MGGDGHAVWAGAKDVAEGGEELQENGLGLGLGVRGQGAHGFPGEAVEREFFEYGFQGTLGLGDWFRLVCRRVYRKIVEAGFARLKRDRERRIRGSRAD
jgi:hypothetical protein